MYIHMDIYINTYVFISVFTTRMAQTMGAGFGDEQLETHMWELNGVRVTPVPDVSARHSSPMGPRTSMGHT